MIAAEANNVVPLVANTHVLVAQLRYAQHVNEQKQEGCLMVKHMHGKKHFTEQLFKTFQLSQRVPEENFYRRLKELLDLHWFYRATKKYYGTEGQQSIDPVVFFKLILIGYLENLGSDRRMLMAAIAYNLKKLLKWTAKKVQADVKAMQASLKTAFCSFIDTTHLIRASYNFQ
jgi:transposase